MIYFYLLVRTTNRRIRKRRRRRRRGRKRRRRTRNQMKNQQNTREQRVMMSWRETFMLLKFTVCVTVFFHGIDVWFALEAQDLWSCEQIVTHPPVLSMIQTKKEDMFRQRKRTWFRQERRRTRGGGGLRKTRRFYQKRRKHSLIRKSWSTNSGSKNGR